MRGGAGLRTGAALSFPCSIAAGPGTGAVSPLRTAGPSHLGAAAAVNLGRSRQREQKVMVGKRVLGRPSNKGPETFPPK